METQQRDRPSVARLIWLLGFLVLFVGGWAVLIFRVPILFPSQGSRPGFRLDRDSGIATLTHSNQDLDNPWAEEIKFDVRSGAFDWRMSREVDGMFFTVGTDPNKNRHRILRLDSNQTDGQYRFVSPPSSEVPNRNFQFPQPPYLVNDRFAVVEEVGNLLVLNCRDENSVIQKTKMAGASLLGGLRAIDGVDGILRFQTVPTFGNPPTYQVQHFSIGENGAAVAGLTWPAMSLGPVPHLCIASAGDERVSINPTNFEVEFRLSSNGQLVDTMPLLSGMNPVTMPCGLQENYLWIEPTPGVPRFLDLRRRRWLPLIDGVNYGPHSDLGDEFILLRGRRGDSTTCKVFDIQKQAVISEFDSCVFADFIDEESILHVSAFSGIAFDKIDLQTGDVLQTWKPFWWVSPLTSFLCVGWLIWSWLWLSGAQRSGAVAIWVDVALVALLPLILCIVRLRFIGDITDLSRIPIEIAQAIILALLFSGVVWLMHTRMRIVPRVLPFLLAITVLAASVTITFDGQLAYVIPGAIQALVPVSAFLVCGLVFRRLGYRLLSPGELECSAGVEKASLVTIRDMFVLMAVLAMLFAGLNPWLPDFGDLFGAMSQVLSALWQFAILSFSPVFAWWLAMSQKKLRSLGSLLFLGTFVFLIAASACRFAGSSSLIFNLFGFFPQITALPAMCFVATYWVACCFRLRGWEFSSQKKRMANRN